MVLALPHSFPGLSQNCYISYKYFLARRLNGYKLERSDSYLDTINFIDYAVKELKEEKAEEARQQN